MKILEIFNKQKSSFNNTPLSTAEERISDLIKLKNIIIENKMVLFDMIDKDFEGRCIDEVFICEIIPILNSIEYIIKNLPEWMLESNREVSPHFGQIKACVQYQPLGVIGIICPWNYPIYLTLSPLIYALCAGNHVMLNTSYLTPSTTSLLKELLGRVFSEEKVSLISGNETDPITFSKLPFDHLLFTGSSNTGKFVMRNAADNLTPITLELGGKSPAIISDSCHLKNTIWKIIYSKTMNSGQTCVAPDYLLVPETMLETIKDQLSSVFQDCYPDFEKNNQYASIINDKFYQRMLECIEDAKNKGAQIIMLGSLSKNRKLPLTLILNTNKSMKIMNEELFGPILPIVTYKDFNEILRHLQHEERPLSLYYFGEDSSQIASLQNYTQSGAFCINDAVIQLMIDDLPFGGVGHSGFGRYHAKEGFLTFSNARSIVRNPGEDKHNRLGPPYIGAAVKYFDKLI